MPFRSYLYNSFPPYLVCLENAFCSDCKRKLHLICFLPDLTLGFSLLTFLYLGSNYSAQNRSVFKKHRLDWTVLRLRSLVRVSTSLFIYLLFNSFISHDKLINFCWSQVDSHCCVSLRWAAEWISSADSCSHSFADSFPIGYCRGLSRGPVLHSKAF